jgi:CRP-like cAMP-binding protein
MTTKNLREAAPSADRLLDSLHVVRTSLRFEPSETIFAQGDRCAAVMYIEKGRVRLSVVSPFGKAAVVAILHAGAFFGEGALAGQRLRKSTAEALTNSTIAIVKTAEMRRRLHEESAFSDWFRSHMLARNVRIEGDLVDQLFNRCEKRLARALLLLAHFDEHHSPRYALPKISRNLLAEMSGTTRSRVDVLMNNFRKLGFLERHSERDGGLQIHRSMLNVVLQD